MTGNRAVTSDEARALLEESNLDRGCETFAAYGTHMNMGGRSAGSPRLLFEERWDTCCDASLVKDLLRTLLRLRERADALEGVAVAADRSATRQGEMIASVVSRHSNDGEGHCNEDGLAHPCPTARALGVTD